MRTNRLHSLRRRVAREAAILLYTSQEKEYKQAKSRAAQTLSARVLPRNAEVAKELDEIAEEREGHSRAERLIQMREEAMKLMTILQPFRPKLVGSVWRGTAHRTSDIDIITFAANHNLVLNCLLEGSSKAAKTEWRSVTKQGKRESSFHIHLALSSGNMAEVAVHNPEKMDIPRKCEIYGDFITGLNYTQLQRVLREDSLQRFVPE